jgi:hypothetical protein
MSSLGAGHGLVDESQTVRSLAPPSASGVVSEAAAATGHERSSPDANPIENSLALEKVHESSANMDRDDELAVGPHCLVNRKSLTKERKASSQKGEFNLIGKKQDIEYTYGGVFINNIMRMKEHWA